MKIIYGWAELGIFLAALSLQSGCGAVGPFELNSGSNGSAGESDGLAAQIAAKALTVGGRIGGPEGFGGTLMDGYLSHMEDHMGFHDSGDLANPGSLMTVEFHNESGLDCTFDVVFTSSPLELDDQTMQVDVSAGGVITIQMPCAEILGFGSLTIVGETAVHLSDGNQVDNRFCVPGFLGSDYLCQDTYRCFLTPDSDDLDADGDTEELIVTTDALQFHIGPEMGGHGHMMGHM